MRVFWALRADNWLHAHGDLDSDQGRAIRSELLEVFRPDDAGWMRRVLEVGAGVVAPARDGLAAGLKAVPILCEPMADERRPVRSRWTRERLPKHYDAAAAEQRWERLGAAGIYHYDPRRRASRDLRHRHAAADGVGLAPPGPRLLATRTPTSWRATCA